MDAKLTLKLDQTVIEKAKEYALLNKISLSRMIESYLLSLVNQNLQSDCNVILSRNAKDFKHTTISVMNAEEFLRSLKRT